MGYRVIRRLLGTVLALFYRRLEIVGIERVPERGPLLIAANHQNGLVDPMLLLATLPRRLVAVAKAPLFRNPFVGPFLRLLGALPVHRRHESGGDPGRNEAMFAAAASTLRAGGAIMIFPEGVSQPAPALMPLRTGAARIVLEAEASAGMPLGVALVPVGLTFHEPGTFRAGRALVIVGRPLPTEDCVARHRREPEAAVRALTDRLSAALRDLIVEAEDRETLRLLRALESIARADAPRDEAARAQWMQQVMRAYRFLRAREPERVERYRAEVERYARDLDRVGMSSRQFSQPYTVAAVWRYTLREGLSLVLGLPLAFWGLANHMLPYRLTAAAVARIRPSPDVEATYKILGAILFYPLCWIGEGWLAWRVGGPWLLGAFLALLVPTGFFAVAWRERLERVAREARGFFRFLVDRDLRRRFAARREVILAELTALTGLVPASVLTGEAENR